MQYRVYFTLRKGGVYYTEWFDTLGEADQFVEDARVTGGFASLTVEDSDENLAVPATGASPVTSSIAKRPRIPISSCNSTGGIVDYEIVKETQGGIQTVMDTFTGSEGEAALYALLSAGEHATNIDVPFSATVMGGRFYTNNGTTVDYYAREEN